ncbi:MAG: 30S ribosomal protein S16 [Planctomycetota bacterium]
MAVKIRLRRMGRRHRPFFRISAMDAQEERDGKVVEDVGTYDPLKNEGETISVKTDRVNYWLSVGAQPSEACAVLLKKSGIKIPDWGKKRAAKRAVSRKKRKERARVKKAK